MIDRVHPANAAVLRYLLTQHSDAVPSQSPADVDTWDLGTHPDLVDHLWQGASTALPQTTITLPPAGERTEPLEVQRCACSWVVYGHAVLVHEANGVVFAFVSGTSTLAVRLPPDELEQAFELEAPRYGHAYAYPSTRIEAASIGPDWTLLEPFSRRVEEWLITAYLHAEML